MMEFIIYYVVMLPILSMFAGGALYGDPWTWWLKEEK